MAKEAVSVALSRGYEEHSIWLLLIIGDYLQCGRTLFKLFSPLVSSDSISDSKKDAIAGFIQKLLALNEKAKQMDSIGSIQRMTEDVQSDLIAAVEISNFFDYYNKGPGYYNNALECIKKAGVLPLFSTPTPQSRDGIFSLHFTKTARSFANEIQVHLADVCLRVMKILWFMIDQIKTFFKYNPMPGLKHTANTQVSFSQQTTNNKQQITNNK
ncbi:hypothetical protein RFI_22210 [Reticulomyxa filosa]|uniref:Uncharacterized protein n=1 Tax=Reticulomyxa filosa TaxID=46433 RepID=X6MPX5_RETFI|nr:hypothetical protein RFI_22210 [Reticulomyxa filosa]|eukprot:ETO15155.1 hypothetical protein RFI_22210 [Reticulomyxa filosa]